MDMHAHTAKDPTHWYIITHRQVNSNLERECRGCIKGRRDKIGITRHVMYYNTSIETS